MRLEIGGSGTRVQGALNPKLFWVLGRGNVQRETLRIRGLGCSTLLMGSLRVTWVFTGFSGPSCLLCSVRRFCFLLGKSAAEVLAPTAPLCQIAGSLWDETSGQKQMEQVVSPQGNTLSP